MSTSHDLYQYLVQEMRSTAHWTPSEIAREHVAAGKLPRIIGLPDGRALYVSRKVDRLICQIADKLFKDQPSLKPRWRNADWHRTISSALAEALASLDYDEADATNARHIEDHIRNWIKENGIPLAKNKVCFGCSITSSRLERPVTIGPVTFYDRKSWLQCLHVEGILTTPTMEQISTAWEEDRCLVEPDKRAPFLMESIIDTVGPCHQVCSVSIEGQSAAAAEESALRAARVTMAAFALCWEESARALDGMYLFCDQRPRPRTIIKFSSDGTINVDANWTQRKIAPQIEGSSVTNFVIEHEEYFRVVGEVAQTITAPGHESRLPSAFSALSQALLWFHDGCREREPLMAIVKFVAAFEALTKGGKQTAMQRLACDSLGAEPHTVITFNGETIKSAVRVLYKDARSRTVHGPNPKISEDWSHWQTIASFLAARCIAHCIELASDPNIEDSPKVFNFGANR